MTERQAAIARFADGVQGVNTLVNLDPVPIVIVPGVMGSRLTDPATGQLVWNPTGTPLPRFRARGQDSFAGKTKQISDLTSSLIPDETHPCAGGNSARDLATEALAAPIRHFLNVVPDFYADLALALQYDLVPRLAPLQKTPRVYCCGYDWRVSNEVSANRLADVVQEALDETGAEKVIIVAHSMGGIVSRFFSKNLGGEANILAMFLIASPCLGAPDAYGTLRNGIGQFFPLRAVLGFASAKSSLSFVRGITSIYQLLPNHVYCSVFNPKWVHFDPALTGISPVGVPITVAPFADCSGELLLYGDIYAGFQDVSDLRSRSLAGIGTFATFQVERSRCAAGVVTSEG